jgi:hypothetical protein
MVLLAQREPDARVTATIASPPPPAPPIPSDFAQKDWGLSIGICALVGMKVWELIKRYHKDDSDLNRELVRGLLDERKILLQALLERKPG